MTDEEDKKPYQDTGAQHPEVIAAVLALADREQELESLRRVLVFSVGISVGLMLALHLAMRRDL